MIKKDFCGGYVVFLEGSRAARYPSRNTMIVMANQEGMNFIMLKKPDEYQDDAVNRLHHLVSILRRDAQSNVELLERDIENLIVIARAELSNKSECRTAIKTLWGDAGELKDLAESRFLRLQSIRITDLFDIVLEDITPLIFPENLYRYTVYLEDGEGHLGKQIVIQFEWDPES
ncbi:MAG: hypothetical protein WC477_04405 [Patescibacteria group bacterium]